MSASHTPGPWLIYNDGVNGKVRCIGPIFGYDFGSLELQPDDPDAFLVSAAPDLFAACLEVWLRMSEVEKRIGVGPQIGDAIAKARRQASP